MARSPKLCSPCKERRKCHRASEVLMDRWAFASGRILPILLDDIKVDVFPWVVLQLNRCSGGRRMKDQSA